MMEDKKMLNIPKEKFVLAQKDTKIYDSKLETKPIGYFKDAWLRFRKNKSAVIAFMLIVLLMLFAIVVPFVSNYDVTFRDGYYRTVLPKNPLVASLGIWDGKSSEVAKTRAAYDMHSSIGVETGREVVTLQETTTDAISGKTLYTYKLDSYYKTGYTYQNLSANEYQALQAYQNETGVQVIYPLSNTENVSYNIANAGANFWYKLKDESVATGGEAVLDENGNFIANYKTSASKETAQYNSLRIEGDNGGEDGNTWYVYAKKNQSGYKVRVDYYEYFRYKNGFEPMFIFGTNDYGQDIFTCLAAGARLSFILAFSVSAINFFLGACYGAIEGYYGGVLDIMMERISDILGSVPFMVVATLFQMHLSEEVGVLGSLLFAFVLTGWIGMASRVRMQFYRFKGQEYVLAARTLGASDKRLIFKHIFPNSLGTIITGSVLAIPGVIFSESMLSYLGIVNLETSSMTSIGTMLSNGQGYLSTYPHIILFPALFISVLEISFNLFGNGLRDAFNPSLRGADE